MLTMQLMLNNLPNFGYQKQSYEKDTTNTYGKPMHPHGTCTEQVQPIRSEIADQLWY